MIVHVGMLLFSSIEGGVLLSVDLWGGHDATRGSEAHHVVFHAHIVRLLLDAMDLTCDSCVAIMDHGLLRSICESPLELWMLQAVRPELVYVQATA